MVHDQPSTVESKGGSSTLDGDESTQAVEVESRRVFVYKVIKQASLVLTWIGMGLYLEIEGPTLIDLKYRLNRNYEEIAQSLVIKSAGAMVGAPLGGIICTKFNKHVDLFISLSSITAACCTIAVPWFKSSDGVSTMLFFVGLAESITNSGGNALVLKMWGEKSGPAMQANHLGFGTGAIIAPLIAKPFLGREVNSTCAFETTTMTALPPLNGSSNALWQSSSDCAYGFETKLENSRIEIAYLIAASIPLLAGIVVLGFYIKGPPKGIKLFSVETKVGQVFNPGACAQGNHFFGIQMLALLYLLYIHVTGNERSIGKFLFSYGVETGMSRDGSANLLSAFWVSFCIGSLVGAIIAVWVRPFIMLTIICGALVVTTAVLAFLGTSNETLLWVCVCAFGFFECQVFPTGMAWANLYLEMTSMAVCIVMLGSYSGGFIYQWVTGYLFENIGPRTLMFVLFGYAVCISLFFAILVVVARRQGQRSFEIDDIEVDSEDRKEDGETMI